VVRSPNLYTSSAILTAKISYHLEREILWRFKVASNNKTYVGLHANFSIFLSIFFKSGFSRHIFMKSPQCQILLKFFNCSHVDTCGRIDGRIGVFRGYPRGNPLRKTRKPGPAHFTPKAI